MLVVFGIINLGFFMIELFNPFFKVTFVILWLLTSSILLFIMGMLTYVLGIIAVDYKFAKTKKRRR